MRTHVDNHPAPRLHEGSTIIFSSPGAGLFQSVRFTDPHGQDLLFPAKIAGYETSASEWTFQREMTAFACFYLTTIIGHTFGLKAAESTRMNKELAFVFHRRHGNYVAPCGLVLDEAEDRLVIELEHKDIATRLDPTIGAYRDDMVSFLAVLHGFVHSKNAGNRITWRKPRS